MDLTTLILNKMIRIKIFIFFLFFVFSSISWASPKIDVKTAILVDYNSDKILYELEPDMSIYPASMTKIMTTIIAFDLLKQGKIKLDDEVIVSENAIEMTLIGRDFSQNISNVFDKYDPPAKSYDERLATIKKAKAEQAKLQELN